MYDSRHYKELNNAIGDLYIMKGNSEQLVIYEGIGQKNHQEIFHSIREDLNSMKIIRSKKFQFLKGLWLYRNLKRYLNEMKVYIPTFSKTLRIEKIYEKMVKKL